MISKEKEILFENFKKKSVNRNYTMDLIGLMMNSKRKQIRKTREEEYLNKVDEWSSQPTFDKSLIGQNNKSKVPTRRSKEGSFQSLQERRINEWEIELEEIKNWLDK